jgi:ribosomal protein L19E
VIFTKNTRVKMSPDAMKEIQDWSEEQNVRTRIAQDQLKALRCSDTKGHARAALGHKLAHE